MTISTYLQNLRSRVGHDLLILPSVSGVVRDSDDGILMAFHSATRRWVLPGGSIEPNESPADALVREMWEETGLQVYPTGLLGVYGGPDFQIDYPNGDQVTYVMIVFECDVLDGETRPDEHEVLQLRYLGQADISRVQLADWAKRIAPDLFSKSRYPIFQAPDWSPKLP